MVSIINLFVPECTQAINYYKNVFDAIILTQDLESKQGCRYARFRIDDILFAILDENFDEGKVSPIQLGGTPFCIQLEVADIVEWKKDGFNMSPVLVSGVKGIVDKAEEFGATILSYTQRDNNSKTTDTECARIRDPYGFLWYISRMSSDNFG